MTIPNFIQKWRSATGGERQNSALFLLELTDALGVPRPEPASANNRDNSYIYERSVRSEEGGGKTSARWIDLYKRGCFVCEVKKIDPNKRTSGFDTAMFAAKEQADRYIRAIPADEGRPPFLMLVDVGNVIELYSEFSRTGGTYVEFPDPRSYRIKLEDLAIPEIAERLRQVWLDPLALDPAKRAAKVTRDIADTLARLAKSLEAAKHNPAVVAQFLMRCLFTMFSEDVGLLPKDKFTELLIKLSAEPKKLPPALEALWTDMDHGGFSGTLFEMVPRFNGKLFKERHAVPLNRDQIDLLIAAAKADWRDVEPAIFGTLLERALNPEERHRLGAHYTPRAYVERLVLPTVIEPLRADWKDVLTAAVNLKTRGKDKDAISEVKAFHHRLTQIRVLDPACGTGNFLYVTLEHLKRLEGDVLNTLASFGLTEQMASEGFGLDPHQLLGIEINPRAAAIAEVVLWIGYLQWHYRTWGDVRPAEPIVRDFGNIENRDAILAYDRIELERDASGKPITRWDGKTTKKHPVTGLEVPDERAQIAVERYINPRAALWPVADFVVGNPPFIGNKRMRIALGDGYVEALRRISKTVPDSADLVMYWWDKAAEILRTGDLRQFGLITTNSLRQTFNRRVLEHHMSAKPSLNLVFAIPDHPWVDASDGAAVRIGMTVAGDIAKTGCFQTVLTESASDEAEIQIEFDTVFGAITSDIRVGANVATTAKLLSNHLISNRGMIPHGESLLVTDQEAHSLGLGRIPGLEKRLPKYVNGRDVSQTPRGLRVIDLFGLTETDVRSRFPEIYQKLLSELKPDRDENNRASVRERWWLFAEPRKVMRACHEGLQRYLATVQTSKFRLFVFLQKEVMPDDKLIAFGVEKPELLCVLSSRIHSSWALASGATLEDRPVYNKSKCFECFPFPELASPVHDADALDSGVRRNDEVGLARKLAQLGEQLDAHRKRQQAAHAELTLTGMYNVLEKLKSGEALNAKEKLIHEQGLVSVLKSLHDEIDLSVLDAYGWGDLKPLMQVVNGNINVLSASPSPHCSPRANIAPGTKMTGVERERVAGADGSLSLPNANPQSETAGQGEGGGEGKAMTTLSRLDAIRQLDETLLERLVALNAERAAEEKRGLIRYLRPEFQDPNFKTAAPKQAEMAVEREEDENPATLIKVEKIAWPKTLPEQVRAVLELLKTETLPADQIATRFKGLKAPKLGELLQTLVDMGRVRQTKRGFGV